MLVAFAIVSLIARSTACDEFDSGDCVEDTQVSLLQRAIVGSAHANVAADGGLTLEEGSSTLEVNIAGRRREAPAAAQPSPSPPINGQPVRQINAEWFGVWDRSNAVALKDFPYVRGKAVSINWRDLEPNRKEYNFTEFDQALTEAGENNAGFYGMVNVGPDSPQWIYKDNPRVPKVDTDDQKHKNMKEAGYPYYLDVTYKKHFFKMIDQLGTYLRSHKYAKNVLFVQTNYGCTGDATLYKGKPKDKKFQIDDTEEKEFMKATWMRFKQALQDGPGPVIGLLINGVDKYDDLLAFVMENISPVGIKGGALARGHHLSGERSWIESYRKYMLNPQIGSTAPYLFTRTEMDQTWKKPYYQLNLPLGYYWGVLNALNQGLSVHDVSKDALRSADKQGFLDSLLFFNKYAGQIWPDNATGAFIALHLGLDVADNDTYPIEKYGKDKKSRLQAVCTEYAKFGCQIDDMEAATKGQVYQRESQEGYNDAGSDIWPTNYARWLEQIDPDETSQGLFRIGGKLNKQSSKYARFARGLRHEDGKTAMYFKFADDFFKQGVGSLSFRIVWYDIQEGSWQLQYKANNGEVKTAVDQKANGDGTWKEISIVIPDASMDRSYTRGSDFTLSSRDSTDAVFHMIEVTRVK